MSSFTVQITYRHGEPLAAYIYFAHRRGPKSVRVEEVLPGLIVDYSRDGSPLGIEILSPRVRIEDLNTIFDKLGLRRPDPADLKPILVAA